jgi:hypothetical protein
MTDIYLTDKIIINQGKYYYENDNKNENERKLINDKNWHRLLSDTGWHKLDKTWIMRLNSFSTVTGNSKWGLLDCDNNGDCFYSVVAEAFNYYYKNIEKDDLMDVIDIRTQIASKFTKENFDYIMNVYKIEKSLNEFYHKWNISDIETHGDLKKELIKSGHNYWADHIIIQLFQEVFQLNIIILKQSEVKKYSKIYSLGTELDSEKKTIILYYIDQMHFKLIGYFDDNAIHTIFSYDNLPEEIIKIYQIDCR